MALYLIVAFNLVLTLYCVFVLSVEGKTLSFVLDQLVEIWDMFAETITKEGKNNDETA